MPKDSGDSAVADQFCLAFRDTSAVGKLDAFDTALRELREEGAESSSHFNERRDFEILLVRKRWQIHCILHHTQLQIFAHLQSNLNADCLLRFGGRSGDVGSKNDILQAEERRILRWLLMKYI